MAFRFTLNRFPVNGSLKDECGLPFGCVVQPFAQMEHLPVDRQDVPPAEDVARCEECFAYVNPYCTFERGMWICSLCGTDNGIHPSSPYYRHASRQKLPELQETTVEFDVEAPPLATDDDLEGDTAPIQGRPVYVALVDLAGGEDFLELVKSSLLAALEALQPSALFGLVTFSHKVGLYDVHGAVPVVKNVPLSTGGGAVFAGASPPAAVELEEAVPLRSLLAPVGKYKEQISTALETLRPISALERATVAKLRGGGDGGGGGAGGGGGGEDEPGAEGSRGFGGALQAVLSYLGGEEEGASYVSARLLSFLSGAPDLGRGRLDTRRFYEAGGGRAGPGAAAEVNSLLVPQTAFYEEEAAAAVASGVCCDLYVVAAGYVDLASMRALATESGGVLFLYPNVEGATLPQDIYRRLSRPQALAGALRLRTSTEFRPARAYGHFFPDERYENLQHVISCDQYDTFAYDFEFANPAGFGRDPDCPPILQLAFQYTVLVPVHGEDEGEGGEGGAGGGGGAGAGGLPETFVMRRRLRVRTVQMRVASTPQDVYESADAEVVLSVLMHKIVRASLDEGVAEGRLLLQDWLVILTAHYNQHYGVARFGDPAAAQNNLDVAFTKCPQLQSLPRLVFALLRSPLLRLDSEGVHPDTRVWLQCMYSSLTPAHLLRAVYPVLSSYSSPDKQAYPRHSLSRAALTTSSSPIFLLDALTALLVYYTPEAPAELPFPPPQSSLLRRTINKLKHERGMTPRLVILRGGVDPSGVFDQYLIEEQDVDGSYSGMGFVAFLNKVTAEVRAFMQ